MASFFMYDQVEAAAKAAYAVGVPLVVATG
jgi:hypothetical protein